MRQALRCPCDGRSHRSAPPQGQRIDAYRVEWDVVEEVSGHRPESCVWYGFQLPDVVRVLRAHRFFEEGQLASVEGDDPPWWLLEAVDRYTTHLAHHRAEVRKIERSNERSNGGRRPPPLPPGHRPAGWRIRG